MTSAPDDSFYHQTKTPISFWCRRGLNPRSLIYTTIRDFTSQTNWNPPIDFHL